MAHGMQTFIDAFSLSLSGESRLAQNSISQPVKQAIPVESLDNRCIEPKVLSSQAERRAADISVAATTEAFANAAHRLQAASDRLKQESDRQAKYWAELARLRAQNWPVSRLPTNSKAIVVHYGSLESKPEYRARGLASLRQNQDGSLSCQSESATHRSVIVRVHRNGAVTGQHSTAKDFDAFPKLEADLMRAREALFQDELFTEASKEARTVSNMGFVCRNHSIRAKVSDGLHIEVLYAVNSSDHITQPQQDDDLAQFVADQLRIMLIAEHKHKHAQRALHQPAPISQKQRSPPEYVLLRSIIAQLRHKVAIVPVLEMLDEYRKCCDKTGLTFEIDHDTSSNDDRGDAALTDLRLPVRSKINIRLPSGSRLDLTAETLLAPPRFGTQWLATVFNAHSCGTTTFPPTNDQSVLRSSFEDALGRDLCQMICSKPLKGVTIAFYKDHPIELVVKQEDRNIAAIRVTCRNARIGVSVVDLKDNSKENILCDRNGLKEFKGNELQQSSSETFWESLIAILVRWDS